MHSQTKSSSPISSNSWRLIHSPPSSSAFNMALDEALLFFSAQKTSLPTLRLYSWEVPTLSLGYAQPSADVDQSELSRRNWQIVRRPTGGKAILHTDELTYSISAPLDNPLVAGSLLESYQRISKVLQKALQLLGIMTNADDEPELPIKHSKNEPVCFQTPSNFEITWKGKKLIGSAQARKCGGVLQHGSLPLYGDLSRITQVLTYSSEFERKSAAQKTLAQATTLEAASGRIISGEEVSETIIKSFELEFRMIFLPGQPTHEELDFTQELVQTKYGSDSWNFRI
jgi:lipoyl(octanoyl) transferase